MTDKLTTDKQLPQFNDYKTHKGQLQSSIVNLNLLIAKINQTLSQSHEDIGILQVQNLKTQTDQIQMQPRNYAHSRGNNNNNKGIHKRNKLSTVIEESITQEDCNSGRIIAPDCGLSSYNFMSVDLSVVPDQGSSSIVPDYGSSSVQLFTQLNKQDQNEFPPVPPYKNKKIQGIRKVDHCSTKSLKESRFSQKSMEGSMVKNRLQRKIQLNGNYQYRNIQVLHSSNVKVSNKQEDQGRNINSVSQSRSRKGLTVISNRKHIKSQHTDKQIVQKSKKCSTEAQQQTKSLQKFSKYSKISVKTKKIETFAFTNYCRTPVGKQNRVEKKIDSKSQLKAGSSCLSRQNPRDFYTKKRINR